MKQMMMVVASAALTVMMTGCGESQPKLTLNGAGASFPAPIYNVWTYAYSQSDAGAEVSYQSVGSGAGRNQIKEGTVDYAGTDDPVSAENCAAWGLIQFPLVRGPVVPIVNLPGFASGELKLSNEVLAKLFLGEITYWNDPQIVALNPGKALPALAVQVVHRSDSSGTSAIYTGYLSKVSPVWQEKVGAGANVKWPCGIGGAKNPGVCNNVAKIAGAIGYTEYTYALNAKLTVVSLPDAIGVYTMPDKSNWPILGTTYILLRQDTEPTKMAALKAYFRWCLTEGKTSAVEYHYTPLSQAEVDALLNGVLK